VDDPSLKKKTHQKKGKNRDTSEGRSREGRLGISEVFFVNDPKKKSKEEYSSTQPRGEWNIFKIPLDRRTGDGNGQEKKEKRSWLCKREKLGTCTSRHSHWAVWVGVLVERRREDRKSHGEKNDGWPGARQPGSKKERIAQATAQETEKERSRMTEGDTTPSRRTTEKCLTLIRSEKVRCIGRTLGLQGVSKERRGRVLPLREKRPRSREMPTPLLRKEGALRKMGAKEVRA